MMYGPGYGYGDMMGGSGWIGGVLLVLFGLLILIGLGLLALWVIKEVRGHHPEKPGHAAADEAIGIARRRLASGEITREEYDEIVRALTYR